MKEIFKPSWIDVERIMENYPIVFLYGTYLPVAIMVFVIHTITCICDSRSKM